MKVVNHRDVTWAQYGSKFMSSGISGVLHQLELVQHSTALPLNRFDQHHINWLYEFIMIIVYSL